MFFLVNQVVASNETTSFGAQLHRCSNAIIHTGVQPKEMNVSLFIACPARKHSKQVGGLWDYWTRAWLLNNDEGGVFVDYIHYRRVVVSIKIGTTGSGTQATTRNSVPWESDIQQIKLLKQTEMLDNAIRSAKEIFKTNVNFQSRVLLVISDCSGWGSWWSLYLHT